MPKKNNESYRDYRDRVIKPLSDSFCGAKFYNATIWLGSGMTASCHHPPAHHIPVDEVINNYRAIHNTVFKKSVRKDMIEGIRPPECEYCWKVEDLGDHQVSDRVYQSVRYTDEELLKAKEIIGYTEDSPLITLEIAFDSNCNFACSYCNASFSTTWMSDIKTKGPYENLISDGGGAFKQDGSWSMPYGKHNEGNPYVDAFRKWWEAELQFTLRELRITGGEVLMSNDFWNLIEWMKDNPQCTVPIALNSNLGSKKALIDRLIVASQSIPKMRLYTSNESYGQQAEYIRDGLKYQEWKDNIRDALVRGKFETLNVMMTINALCLSSITEFMDDMLVIKEEFGHEFCMMSFNILRFPSFQSVSTLPLNYRKEKAKLLNEWLVINWHNREKTNKGRGVLHELEFEGITRMIQYMEEVQEGHSQASDILRREHDFKVFYEQYDKRRGKDFLSTFPDLKDWYQAIDPLAIEKALNDNPEVKRKIIPIIAIK